MQIEQSTGTENICIVSKVQVLPSDCAKWLISFGWDDEHDMFVWHEIRWMTETQMQCLGQRFIACGERYDMLNLSSVEIGDPLTLDDWLEDR